MVFAIVERYAVGYRGCAERFSGIRQFLLTDPFSQTFNHHFIR